MSTQVNYLIVGQGICGTLLSRQLLRAGKTVMVIDDNQPGTASKVASGVVNPVTGRRIVRTWRIETLLPFALKEYTALEAETATTLVNQVTLLDFHPTAQMQQAFEQRLPQESNFLHAVDNQTHWKRFFNFHYGAGAVTPCLLVNLHTLLQSWRQHLQQAGAYMQTRFHWDHCQVSAGSICYHNVVAEKIIFCEGVAGFDNPYFKNLPFSHMKGEALIVRIPGLPATHLYKQGITIVPWHDGLFWVGSSYQWDFKDLQPTAAWRRQAETQLRQWLTLPFEVVDHLAADRPANLERRPFVGLHPAMPSVGIFNGMGAKGCSLAPFFAHQFAQHLLHQAPIDADADVKRFEKTLGRNIT